MVVVGLGRAKQRGVCSLERMMSWFYDVTQRRNVNDFVAARTRFIRLERSNEQWAVAVVAMVTGWWQHSVYFRIMQ